MPELMLPGCRTTPLAGYLAGLGVLRAVTRIGALDPNVRGSWDAQRFVMHGRFADVDEFVAAMHTSFEPEAIVSPWNEGAGLREKSSNRSAAKNVDWVRSSHEPRLDRLRSAIAAADEVVERGLHLGWGGIGKDLWDKKRKPELLRLCRAMLPDEALHWLDAVAVVGQDADPAYSRLLGTGGNFGRQDLSATYLSRVRQVVEDQRSADWLRALLTGAEPASYVRETVGQFDPGRAGGVQSSPWEKADADGFVNPWSFLLAVEGALLFASALARRHGAECGGASLPFQVRGTTSGHDSAAPSEVPLGEFWAPEWTVPLGLSGLCQLLGEGRAQWRGGPARTGLDFVRAIGNLGIDRDLSGFERFLFVDRLGQNPLAVPAGRVTVGSRSAVDLLARIDAWLDAVRRDAPTEVAVSVRRVERALFTHARSGRPADLADVFAEIGRCHDAVSRSGRAREQTWPLVLLDGRDGGRRARELADTLADAWLHDAELRVALALATAHDSATVGPGTPAADGLRALLSPVVVSERRRLVWSARPSPATTTNLVLALTEAARRRCLPSSAGPDSPRQATPDSSAEQGEGEVRAAVLGPRIGFWLGLDLQRADIEDFVAGRLADDRIGALLGGLLTVDWHGVRSRALGSAKPAREDLPDPVLDLLLPFAAAGPLTYRQVKAGEQSRRAYVLLRPGAGWPALLAAGRVHEVLADATRRLRIAGIDHVITPHHQVRSSAERLAAVLLLRTGDATRRRALSRIADLPPSQPADKETTL